MLFAYNFSGKIQHVGMNLKGSKTSDITDPWERVMRQKKKL